MNDRNAGDKRTSRASGSQDGARVREGSASPSPSPERGGLDYVAIIPQSPSLLFVYWELGGLRSEHYNTLHNDMLQWRLCLIALGEDGAIKGRSETPIDPQTESYYLHVRPGERYRVELGVRVGDVFHPVCHSRERRAPRATPPASAAGTRTASRLRGRKGPSDRRPPGLEWREEDLGRQPTS